MPQAMQIRTMADAVKLDGIYMTYAEQRANSYIQTYADYIKDRYDDAWKQPQDTYAQNVRNGVINTYAQALTR